MTRKHKIMIGVLAVVAILVVATTATAFATPRGVTPAATPTNADYQAWGCPVANGNYEGIAELLGLTPQEIETQLEQGKSLVEIAAAQGVTEDELVTTILTPMKEFMGQQVTAGRWTQEQLDSHLEMAEQHIRQIINTNGYAYNNQGCGGQGMMWNWRNNGVTPGPGGSTNGNNQYGRGGMMGGGFGGMMGGSYGGRTGGGFGGMMGGWY